MILVESLTLLSVNPCGQASKQGRKPSSKPINASGSPLSLLLQAYHLGRGAPLLRRRVALALATLTGPMASLLFLHLSMGATVGQQYAAAIHSRLRGTQPELGEASTALSEAISMLEPPGLPASTQDKLQASATRQQPSVSQGKGKAATASSQGTAETTPLFEELEEWASSHLLLLSGSLVGDTTVCSMAVLPHDYDGTSLLLSRWSACGRHPVLLHLPLPRYTPEPGLLPSQPHADAEVSKRPVICSSLHLRPTKFPHPILARPSPRL